MNRLQKKCLVVAVGMHLLLGLTLIVGPGFLPHREQPEDTGILDVIPDILTAGPTHGGNPNAKPPPSAPPPRPQVAVAQPEPPRPAPRHEEPRRDPPKEIVKETKPSPEAIEPSKPRKPHTIIVSTKPVVRKADGSLVSPKPAAPAVDNHLADASRDIGRAVRSLRQDLSAKMTIDTDFGPGGGGPAAANYAEVVRSVYWHAWIAPDDTASDQAITKVRVTISRDGLVLSAKIIEPSGDSQADQSVQRTLDRVTKLPPFEEGAKDTQRTYIINFNLKAKRSLG